MLILDVNFKITVAHIKTLEKLIYNTFENNFELTE